MKYSGNTRPRPVTFPNNPSSFFRVLFRRVPEAAVCSIRCPFRTSLWSSSLIVNMRSAAYIAPLIVAIRGTTAQHVHFDIPEIDHYVQSMLGEFHQ